MATDERETERLETVNARISDTMLGIADHTGCMTFFLYLEWRGCGQVLGDYALDQKLRGTDEREGRGPGIIAIRKILEVVGVDSWEKLKGQLVRLKVTGLGSMRPPIIGHILEDRWFDLKEFAATAK